VVLRILAERHLAEAPAPFSPSDAAVSCFGAGGINYNESMPLARSARLGSYEILSSIGAGGMGEVYRARDTKLGRDVAIKVLPDAFSHDAERMARFEREAQVLASLNHPNIATIHGVEESNGVRALVMELVEGPTLADRIVQQGPLPLDEALSLAKQIAEGLEYAHEKGVIHRDLKPANIKVTPDGMVKLLDFGLAKAAEEPTPQGNPSVSPTLTMQSTQAGVILGTAAYMSPEQASGQPVDRRSDIWSFGVVLWEMLTGQKLFAGETISHTLADILRAPIDFNRLHEAPASIRELLCRCLDRDRRNRLRDIGEARVAIQKYLANPANESKAPVSVRPGWLWPSTAAVFLLLAVVFAFVHFSQKPPAQEVARFEITAPPTSEFTCCISISPDGRKIAFTARRSADVRPSLWVRSLDSVEAKSVYGNFTGTPTAPHPFWSPDSRFIAFSADGKIRTIEAAGGPAQIICNTPPMYWGGAWSPRGVIIMGSPFGLIRVSAAGGEPTPLTVLDQSRNEVGHEGPSFLPDGIHFLYLRLSRQNKGIYVGSLDAIPAQQDTRQLLATNLPAVYAPGASAVGGHILFLRENVLMSQRFDTRRLAIEGDAVPVAESVDVSNGRGAFAASSAGTLIYRSAAAQGTKSRLTWFDRKGKVVGRLGDASEYRPGPSLSPDGLRVAIRVGTSTASDIWLVDSRGISSRFTFDQTGTAPIWSPDGNRIVFSSYGEPHFDLYQKPSNGTGEEALLFKSDEIKVANSWSPDGRFLIFHSLSAKTGFDLWLLPDPLGSPTGHHPIPWLQTEFNERQATFSPDMRWIAYLSNESGSDQVYVRPFIPPNSRSAGATPSAGKWQVSKDGASLLTRPKWRSDGKELLFESLPGKTVMAAEVKLAPEFHTETPHPLFRLPSGTVGWDVTSDNKRFLAAVPETSDHDSAAPPESIKVVLNWTAGLKP